MLARLAALLLLLCGLVACGHSATPSTTQKKFDLGAIRANNPLLGWDPNIKTGRLPNGLTYYVLPNHKPAKRAQLWLALNAGSTQEDEDQHGLAHFTEHMAFNGTRRFPKHDLTEFVERSGARIGPDVNATTSFDETVYKLQLPTDRPELVAKGIQVLRDFADGVTFDPAEVEKERGVILEEWRLKRGASSRLAEKREAELQNASVYVTHKPIGNAETIKSAPAKTIERFYRDWYRPDLMAVIAVGDFDGADIESKLKSEFATLENPERERERTPHPLRYSERTTVTVDTDPELSQVKVEVDNLMAHRPLETVKDFRRQLTESLWTTMLASRLDELARQPEAPFLSGTASFQHPTRPTDVLRQTALVREEGLHEGLAALFRELLRVERHGFTATELERAKASALRSYSRAVTQAERRDSAELTSRLVSAFMNGETLRSPSESLALAKEALPLIGVAEVNKVSSLFAKGRHVSVSGPPSMARPSEDAVKNTVLAVVRSTIPPYQDEGVNTPLMAYPPTPGSVVSTATQTELGVTDWKLKNGVRVLVRPTELSSDTIRMGAFSPGGTSLATDADFDSARFAAEIVSLGGVGPLDDSALRKSLAGKVVRVNVDLQELEESLNGYAAVDDLETMLQWVHLAFTAPRRDDAAFNTWRARQIASLKTKQLAPEAAFAEELAVFATQGNPRRRPPTAESYQRINLDKALSIYRDRFGDAGDFTFVFVGNIDLAKLKPLVETYLGSLPSAGRQESWRDLGITRPAGVQKKVVHRGTEPKSRVSLTFHGPETFSQAAVNDMSLLAEVLHLRLRETLREEMGGVYTVSVSGSIARRPRTEYSLNVSFGCAPENVDKLVRAVLDEAARLQEKGADADTITRAREIKRRTRETSTQDDAWWLKRLIYLYTYGDEGKPPAEPTEKAAARVQGAAKRYLDSKQYLLGVLDPVR
ncbi:MAG: insulinase family protein [Labilithrix sp.]